MSSIKAGQIVRGPRWPEPVELKLVEELGGYVRLVGATIGSGEHVDQLILRDELDQLQVARVQANFTPSPREVFLGLEARRYRFASLYDPLLAMNTSKVDPLPHQIEAVYGYMLRLPRIRFLIADDPGAGKTIMAGLVIKELKLRHLARRILIVVPGHLKDQWRREMKERFEETFVVIDRGLLDSLYGENVWQREAQVITSMDFAKQDDILPSLTPAPFDLVIVDEAHKMSAYRYGNKLERTGRYRLGEVLSRIATHLLFLTATPHKGDPENFRLFLDLLEPGFFATNELLEESIQNKDNPLFIRRIKEDLQDFEGRPLFLPRHVRTKSFNLGAESPGEKDLYNALSRYVSEQYNRALTRDRRRNVAFALIILQRRLASSTYALYRSLERRRRRLEELLQGALEDHRTDERSLDFETAEDLSEAERWRLEEIWETLSVAENREELKREILTLEGLIQQAQAIIQRGEEVKLRHLKEALSDLNREHPGAKILIFTESRDTLEYLTQRIRELGYSVCTIHGGMRLEERIQAESVFKNEAQVLVATEAAGEGINLQFCHLMLNYDIPWNPNRLEQRMGRIHRYGQTREVFVFNLVAEDTREGRVLTRLFEKLEEIRRALGSDKVFDVLDEVLYGKNLAQLLLEAAASARSMDDILKELDIQVDESYIAQVRENLGESLAPRYIDYTRIREMAEQAREHRLLYDRREQGENVDLVIRNKEEQKRTYEQALVALQQTVEQERSLTMGMPRFVGMVRVVPARPDEAMQEDPDIEQVGMQVSAEYEREQGRVPEDVSSENLGFDIRSTDPATGRKRYIEVKARAKVGAVELTQNEWFKARRFGSDYYLYVVLKAATRPELHIIYDPAACLQPAERVDVRYLVPVKEIIGTGELATAHPI